MPTSAAERRKRQQIKQAPKRERERAARAEYERLEGIRLEALAEDQAPAAQRHATELRGPLAIHDPQRGGYRRANALALMRRTSTYGITRDHLIAANRLSEDYEVGVEGARLGLPPNADTGDATKPDVPQSRMAALDRYRAACDIVGPLLRTPVQLIALHNLPLDQIAGLLKLSAEGAAGWIRDGLAILVTHYGLAAPDKPEPALMVDPAIIDIGQDRLGRARVAT